MLRKITFASVLVIFASILVLSIGGCSQNLAQKSGESLNVNEMNISSDKLPENWPSSVPVIDKITIKLSNSSKSDNKMSWNIEGTFEGTSDALYNFYKDKMSGWNLDYDNKIESENRGNIYNFGFSNDKYTVSFSIGFMSGTMSGTSIDIKIGVHEI